MNKYYMLIVLVFLASRAYAREQQGIASIQYTNNLPASSPLGSAINSLFGYLNQDGLKYPCAHVPYESPMKPASTAFFVVFVDAKFDLPAFIVWLNTFYGNITHRVVTILTALGSIYTPDDFHDANTDLYSITYVRYGLQYIISPIDSNLNKMNEIAQRLNKYME